MAETLEQLYAEAQLLLDDILKADIAPWAEDILRNRIQRDIYDVYTPKKNGWVTGMITGYNKPMWGRQRATYQRRHDLPRLVYSTMPESGRLFITSAAQKRSSIYSTKNYPAHPGSFLELLEGDSSKHNGGMGVWAGGFPRPAVSIAQSIVNKNLQNVVQRAIDARLG